MQSIRILNRQPALERSLLWKANFIAFESFTSPSSSAFCITDTLSLHSTFSFEIVGELSYPLYLNQTLCRQNPSYLTEVWSPQLHIPSFFTLNRPPLVATVTCLGVHELRVEKQRFVLFQLLRTSVLKQPKLLLILLSFSFHSCDFRNLYINDSSFICLFICL